MAPARGQIDRPIGRHRADRKRMSSLAAGNRTRAALTEWQVLEYFAPVADEPRRGVSLVRLLPHTGRTHQLRVHCSDMGFPLVGDKLYGRKRGTHHRQSPMDSLLENFPRQGLHADRLLIALAKGDKPMAFHAPLAPDMGELLMTLRQLSGRRAASSDGHATQRG
jgi:23S rRNA pseudouridine1911/1915/1917 synthase